jgi:hypothetical protein
VRRTSVLLLVLLAASVLLLLNTAYGSNEPAASATPTRILIPAVVIDSPATVYDSTEAEDDTISTSNSALLPITEPTPAIADESPDTDYDSPAPEPETNTEPEPAPAIADESPIQNYDNPAPEPAPAVADESPDTDYDSPAPEPETTPELESAPALTLIVAAHDSPNPEEADFICDGFDDQKEIQAAIEALPPDGGRILLLEGTFNCSECIALRPNLPIAMVGQGSSTVLNFDSSVTSQRVLIYHHYKWQWVDLGDIVLSDFKIIDTCPEPHQSFGVMTGWIRGSGEHKSIIIDGLETVECGIWVANVNPGQAIVKNCYVHDITVGDRAIGITASNEGLVYNNRVERVQRMGIGSPGCNSLIVHDNYLKATGQGGTDFAIDNCNSTNVDIFNNTMEECRNGILCENSVGNINIHDNAFKGMATSSGIGIQVWRLTEEDPKTRNVTIRDNIVQNVNVGISVQDLDDAMISFNEVRNTAGNAIQVGMNADWGSNPRVIQINENNLFNFAQSDWQCGINVFRIQYVNILENIINGNSNANSRGIRFTATSAPDSSILRNNIVGVTYDFVDLPADTKVD